MLLKTNNESLIIHRVKDTLGNLKSENNRNWGRGQACHSVTFITFLSLFSKSPNLSLFRHFLIILSLLSLFPHIAGIGHYFAKYSHSVGITWRKKNKKSPLSRKSFTSKDSLRSIFSERDQLPIVVSLIIAVVVCVFLFVLLLLRGPFVVIVPVHGQLTYTCF